MSEKIEKIKKELLLFETHLKKYKKLYINSGLSEDTYAFKIDQCKTLIAQCMAKLERRKPKEEVQGIEHQEIDLQTLKTEIKSTINWIDQVLLKLN